MKPLLIFLVLAGGGLLISLLLGPETKPDSKPKPADQPLMPDARGLLRVGEQIPPYPTGSWLNGEPAPLGSPSVKLTVLDLWVHWCPFCRTTAPSLVQLHEKYQSRGVQFVSMTNMNRDMVQEFIRVLEVKWPSAYEIPDLRLHDFGVINPKAILAEYTINPTLYLIDPSGKVLWCDQQLRLKHTVPTLIKEELDKAIETHLH